MTCPTGYFQIPGDTSNCISSTSSTIVKKVCPSGLVLQENGTCGTGTSTILQSATLYCGPQYATKNCSFVAQLTTALTPALGTEAIPNTICAYQENGTQIACDPGCCTEKTTSTSTSEPNTQAQEGQDMSELDVFILVLSVVGFILLSLFVFFVYKKYRKTVDGSELFKRV
jgi:hypothetical protein